VFYVLEGESYAKATARTKRRRAKSLVAVAVAVAARLDRNWLGVSEKGGIYKGLQCPLGRRKVGSTDPK
jgi:hypothetical protein